MDCWPWKVHCLNPYCVLQSLTDDEMSRLASPAARPQHQNRQRDSVLVQDTESL